MIFGIIKDGVRSAFVRIVRYIVFAILFLLIFYIIGIFTNKKASALTYKGTTYSGYTSSNTKTGTLNAGQGSVDLSYEMSNKSSVPDADVIGFRLNSFNVEYSSYTNGHNISCSGYYNVNNNPQAINVQSSLSFTCTDLDTNLPIADTNYIISINANIIQVVDNVNVEFPCWKSSDYQDTLLCPNDKVNNIYGIKITLRYNSPVDIFYRVDLTGLKFKLNFENTDVITNQGTIISQQEQQNQYIQSNDTTTSQSNATNSLNAISGQFNDVLNGWGGEWSQLTHVVLEPINTILYAFDSGTTCQPIVLQVPYMENKTITLPCMSSIYGQFFGNFIALFVMIISGFYGYRTVMYVIRTIKDVIDAENDKIEVIDL